MDKNPQRPKQRCPQIQRGQKIGALREIFQQVSKIILTALDVLYYEARNDYTNKTETVLLCNRCACNWKINSRTSNACHWRIHRKYHMKALHYTKEFLPESLV